MAKSDVHNQKSRIEILSYQSAANAPSPRIRGEMPRIVRGFEVGNPGEVTVYLMKAAAIWRRKPEIRSATPTAETWAR